jgi:hypothetical protein
MLKRLWKASAPLTATGWLMLPVLAGALIGLGVDDRVITGAPAWLKPAKFAVSIAIYSFTLAWIFSFLPAWPLTRRVVGRVTAVVLPLEMALISLQAWRGVTSHFNIGTPFDAALFGVMGAAILVQTMSTIAVALALWREQLPDKALGWALRLGMTMTIIGALTGGLMTRPTRQQLDEARAGTPMTIAGAHTVGAADGGPGMTGTGWSTAHGDLRVPHFVGLHALQVLPAIALVLARRRVVERLRVRLTVGAAISYASLYVLLLVQALSGQSVAAPGAVSLTLLAGWMVGTATFFVIAGRRARAAGRLALV